MLVSCPRPLQKPSPPIFMAAAVSPESFVAAGEKGHSILLAPFFQSRGALKENVQRLQGNAAALRIFA